MKSLVISSMASWKLPELGGRLENHLLLGDFRARKMELISHCVQFSDWRSKYHLYRVISHINIIKYEISQTIRGISLLILISHEICIFWWL